MPLWVVDSDWYFLTAAILGRAGEKVASAAGIVSGSAHQSGHMAGNDPIGTKWGTRYDSAARDALQGADALAQAWSSLAGRIYQAGVNHAWAEFRAGRRKIPVPANLPPRPSVSEPSSTISSSVGGNGVGLTDILPGLVEAVGKQAPNADTTDLDAASDMWQRFAATVADAVSDVVNQVKSPDRSLPDANAFYDTVTSLSAPADAVVTDARSLSSLTRGFSTSTTAMRQQIASEVNRTAMWIGGTASVSVLSSEVTGGASLRAEAAVVRRFVTQAGNNIRGYIAALETAAAAIDSFTAALDAAKKGLLDREKFVDIEIFDPDGTKTHHYRIPLSKWLSWQNYLQRGGHEWDWNRWSANYDQLKENSANGWWFDQYAANVMGYDKTQGWTDQFGSRKGDLDHVPVQGRVWDWANPELQQLVENKSGRLDMDQLAKDEQAMQAGWSVTYNLNANYAYSPAELAALQRMQERYPGQFTVNRL
jgi:hypothetical protein